MSYHLLIKGGRVVDGSGNPAFHADVAIHDGRIVAIGSLNGDADHLIDATGRVVAPGFVDIHSHSDGSVLTAPLCESFVLQGITTILNGNCGHSFAPYLSEDDRRESLERVVAGYAPPKSEEVGWLGFGEYLEAVATAKPSLNVACLVGHNRLREAVVGHQRRAATPAEMKQMQASLQEALEAGAVGMSTGLVWSPGMFASTDEIAELSSVLSAKGRLYASHMRVGDLGIVGAAREAIEIGRKAGCRVQMSHATPGRAHIWGHSQQLLELIEGARADGQDVLSDAVPYVRGSGELIRVLPPQLQAAGVKAQIEALSSPSQRGQLRREIMDRGAPDWGSTVWNCRWEYWNHTIVEQVTDGQIRWQSLAEIAEQRKRDPLETAFDLILENPDVRVQNVAFSEVDHRALLGSGYYAVEVDAIVQDQSPPADHPRTFGGFPAVFRKYVRGETDPMMPEDEGKAVFSIEHAVKIMTSLPAQILHAFDRGLIRPGFHADLVVLDAKTIRDQATYAAPNLLPTGIDHVIVNGAPVVEHGKHIGSRPGMVLRAGHELG